MDTRNPAAADPGRERYYNHTGEARFQDAGGHIKPPMASVCIGCFNQEAFIELAIRSVAAQTYASFECVVVDDCSTDNSRQRIEDCLSQLGDNRFSFVPAPQNRGQMATILAGLDATSGPFVAFLDGDDLWQPEFLESHIDAHLDRSGIAAVSSSDEQLIDKSGSVIVGGHPSFRRGGTKVPRARAGGDTNRPELVFVDRGVADWLWSSTSGMMFRRDALDVMRPGSPEAIRICADIYLARAAHMLGGTVRIDRVLGSYRIHGGNGWASGRVLGSNVEIGNPSPHIEHTIRDMLADRWCEVAPELSGVIPKSKMRRTLVDMLGWPSALALLEKNPDAAFLLKDWASPQRKLLVKLSTMLPRRIRPRRMRHTARE